MIVACQSYITEKLKAAMGATTIVLYTQKELTECVESHVAAVLLEQENLERAFCKADTHPQIKLFNRSVQFSVVLGEYSMAMLEPMYCQFLCLLGQRLSLPGGKAATIEVGTVEWTAKEDGILKAKIAALVPVTISGGIYTENNTGHIKTVHITTKQE